MTPHLFHSERHPFKEIVVLAYRTIGWWYWLAALILLAIGHNGHDLAWLLLIELMCAQIIHFAARTRSLVSFPVQVRVVYLELLLLGLWEPLQFIHWMQLAGTAAMVLFGYCPLARTMSLLPWNRREPLNAALIWRTIAELPRIGTVHHGLGDREPDSQAEQPWTCDAPSHWPQPKPKTRHS